VLPELLKRLAQPELPGQQGRSAQLEQAERLVQRVPPGHSAQSAQREHWVR
jgi:hypothetical protein